MEAYVRGPVFGALRSNPLIAAVSSRDFTVLERPTRITQRARRGANPAPADSWAA